MKGNQANKFTDPALAVVVDSGISAVRTFTINRKINEVFQFACEFGNLRKVMKHMDAAQVVPNTFEVSEQASHKKVAWAATKDGDDIFAFGTLELSPDFTQQRTVIRVSMKYEINRSKVKEKLDDWFGDNLEDKIIEDIRHFKQFVETGETPTIEGQPRGRCGRSES